VTSTSFYTVTVDALQQRLRRGNGAPDIEHRFDPRKTGSAEFIDALHRFNELIYRPVGLIMPRWAMYDCGVVPGIALGLACDSSEIPETLRTLLQLPLGYSGPVPLSMMVAIPTLDDDDWLTYTVASAHQILPDDYPEDSRRQTLEAGIALLGARCMTALTQWKSTELAIHAAIAPLELLAAWVPAHSLRETAVFRYRPSDDRVLEADDRLGRNDTLAILTLQRELEAGHDIWVAGPPDGEGQIPLARNPQ
jgi:hypothetical protein